MSLIARWFDKSSKLPARADAAQPSVFAESLRTAQHDSQTAASLGAKPLIAPHAAEITHRPGERSARREMVYSSVRESMVRSGILSAGYKFKVLALDKRATQFIVMIDLAEQFSASPDKLSQIEREITEGRAPAFLHHLLARFRHLLAGEDAISIPVRWRRRGRCIARLQIGPARTTRR